MISWFRYVPHAEVAMYERQGCMVVAHLRPVHGTWSVLMRSTGESAPEALAKAAGGPGDD